ncbi:GrpB family protein [Mammaliicoccus sciuri]|uniref:GrpB family protein n=1 Tax=Mammaliicoccus sciuri TaxID=1296 RepID=UPI001FB389CE|nr:GrpB family protein [Mammaliicoccus sciuri]MCJ0913576.1 GrpB family protein [Mammaliicoccus sciuri]
MKVNIEKYNPYWVNLFANESNNIKRILGDELHSIHHIGSTSIPHISAKPIIDIMPIVNNIDNVDKYNLAFEEFDYDMHGEYGIVNRRYFTKLDKQTNKKLYHVHLYDRKDDKNIIRHLAFRDFLIEFPEVAKEYEDLKMTLINKYCGDKEKYVNGKNEFVKMTEKLAINWYLQKKITDYNSYQK